MEITKFCESDFLFYEPHLWFCSFQETLTNSTGCVRSSVIESVLLALLYVLSLGDKTMFSSGWILCCHSILMIQKILQNLTFRHVQNLLQGYLSCCRHWIVLAMFARNCDSRVTSSISCKIYESVLFSQRHSDFERSWEVWESKRQWSWTDRNASCFRWFTKITEVSLFPLCLIIL